MSGVEFAWRVHTAQEQWLVRVDTKAAVVFTVEGVVVAAVLTALGNPALSDTVDAWRLPVAWTGTVFSASALLAAFFVVAPYLDGKGADSPDFIYFGQLRRWEAAPLAAQISELSVEDEIAQLATQLARLGVVNWRKYLLLRAAMLAAGLGALLLVVAFAWPRS